MPSGEVHGPASAAGEDSERATEALKEYLPPRASVRRGGEAFEVEARSLVPGDVLLLSEGEGLRRCSPL